MVDLPHPKATLDRCGRYLGCTALAASLLAAPWARADEQVQDVFVTRGAYGEVSFSDEERPGAERLRLAVVEPAAEAVEAAERRVEQTLRVARALEASRLAREQARAQARPATPPAPALVEHVPADRYLVHHLGRPAYPHVSPRHQRRRSGHDESPAQPPAEPTLSAPLLRRGGSWETEDRSSWLRAAEG
jgi:hypothetical protein